VAGDVVTVAWARATRVTSAHFRAAFGASRFEAAGKKHDESEREAARRSISTKVTVALPIAEWPWRRCFRDLDYARP